MGSFKKFITKVTVEPGMFFFMVGMITYIPLLQDVLKLKVCHKTYNLSWELCQNLTTSSNKSHMDNDIKRIFSNFTAKILYNLIVAEASNWQFYSTVIQTIPAMFFSFFVGPWTDKFGQKIPMMLPSIGYCVAASLLLVNEIYKDLPLGFMLFISIPISLSGGILFLMMTMFSYVSGITNLNDRTIRIALVDVVIYSSQIVGSLAGGQLLTAFGYKPTFLFLISSFCLCFLYIFFRITNIPHIVENKNIQLQKTCDKNHKGCRSLFNIENLKECFRTALVKRENNGRMHLLLLVSTMCLFLMTLIGEMEILYYYVSVEPLNWDFLEYTYFNASKSLIAGICIIIFIPILKKYLRFRDTTMSILGNFSRLGNTLIVGFVLRDWMMYVAAGIGVLSLLPASCTRSLLSKIVAENEQGKLFAFVASVESVAPLVASVLFNKIFQLTIKYGIPWKAIPFLISAFFTTINIIIHGFIHSEMKQKYKCFKDDLEDLTPDNTPKKPVNHYDNPLQV